MVDSQKIKNHSDH